MNHYQKRSLENKNRICSTEKVKTSPKTSKV